MLISLTIGALVMIGVYGLRMTGVFFIISTMFYVPCRYGVVTPSITTLVALLILGLIHYESMIAGTSFDRFSHTGTLMVMVAKISMFSFHAEDGRRMVEGSDLSSQPHVSEQRAKLAVSKADISFGRYMVYIFEFAGSLVGPLFSYKEYMDFYEEKGDFQNLRRVPYLRESLKAIARAFVILGLYVFLNKQWWFGAETMLTDWFVTLPVVSKLVLSPFLVAGCRLAYYAVWSLSEVACTLSGISFVPPSRFVRGRNVNLRMFELSSNFNSVTNNWNIRISDLWLKQCIYQRVEFVPRIISGLISNKKGLANFLTKLTSALWHGWYPGYMISFLSLGLCNWSENLIRKKIHPRLPPGFLKGKFSSVLGWAHTWWSMNVFFASFLLLTWEKTAAYYSSIHWCGHLYHLAIIIVCSVLPSVKTAKTKFE
jgi:lysophospholipid acyltransferase